MNKIVNQKTEQKKQRSNYHQQSNVNLREGSSSVQKRRRQIPSVFANSSTSQNSRSSYETLSKSRSQSLNKSKSNSRPRSTKQLKSVKGRKSTPIPTKKFNQSQLPCKFWMQGKCNKFEQCKFRHYQMSQILFKQNKMDNKVEHINQEQSLNNKILVKIEQTSLMTQEELMHTAMRAPEGVSTAIQISYKNKKAMNKLKNKLNKNQKDLFTNNEQKKTQEKQILNELLKNTQIDNKNKNALMIKDKIEKIKKEQYERTLILKNKPKIIINKELEEKLVQNQQQEQNQQQQQKHELIIESDEQSDDEIDMTYYNQNYQENSNNIQNNNNTQSNYQLNNQNQSQYKLDQPQQNQPPLQNNYIDSPQLDQLPQGLNNLNSQTLMSPTYIQEKDKHIDDIQLPKQKLTQQQIDEQITQDMNWYKNIKSLYQQWKQTRDGKDHTNIHPSSAEPTKKSPIDSLEMQEIIDESNQHMLYDWKKSLKSKAYRNDDLQKFINYQQPKLISFQHDKVFNLEAEFLSEEALLPEHQQANRDAQKLYNEKKISGTLNIFYNKSLLEKSLENYSPEELTKHFFYATDSPEKSDIYKMAIIINRYIKNLLHEIMLTKIKNTENQKINISKEQSTSSQLAIIETLRNIIIQNNTQPQQMYYITNQGTFMITFYQHHALNQDKINQKAQEQKQNQSIKYKYYLTLIYVCLKDR